jgi:carbonic anhydrase/acetyltransferase-like protein (isoleucine patch superfamily)
MTLERWKHHAPNVAPTAFVHETAVVIGEVSIGAESSIWPGAVLRGDDGAIAIGEQTSIQDLSVIHATTGWSKTTIGARVTVGHRVILHGCTVEDECLIGMGAILLDNCVIGRGSVIGAGALVTVGQVIPPGSLVLGMPAKVVRACGDKERGMIEMGWREYVERTHEYQAMRASASMASGE